MAQKRGPKKNKQAMAAQRARNQERLYQEVTAKDKKKRGPKEIAVIIISVIVALSLMLPSLALIFGQGTSSTTQGESIPTSFEGLEERYQPVVDQYQADLDADPDDANAEYRLGTAYFEWASYARFFAGTDEQKEQVDEMFSSATKALTTFIEQQGGYTTNTAKQAAVSKALCAFYQDDAAQAIEQLQTLGDETDYAPAWANLGMVYESEDDDAKAIAAYEKGIAADPDGGLSARSYCEERIKAIKSEAAASTGGAQGLQDKLDPTAESSDASATTPSTDGGSE